MCTWNIEFGLRLDAVLDSVRRTDDFRGLDLFCLQEASVHEGRPDAQRIAEAMGAGYDHFQATAQVRRGLEQANALIWRRDAFQPAQPYVLSLGEPAFGKMTRAERTLLRAIAPQQRMAIRAESPTLRVYVVHLDVVGFTHKIEQLGAVIADMASRPQVPLTLVAGDLNTFGPPGLQLWRRLADTAMAAGMVDVTRGVRSTHWTSQKLDAIFVQAAEETRSRAWTLDVRASDHQPVFADIEPAAGA
ncbi:MAG: endonuclease/exonuclease/phosphatase family protein [Candidatus Dormibacteraceae bacterium]